MNGGDGDDIEELVQELEARLSQESDEAEEAEGVRSRSDDELEVESSPQEMPAWWINSIMRHTEQFQATECTQPLKLISACTGACAEGHVLEVSRCLLLVNFRV